MLHAVCRFQRRIFLCFLFALSANRCVLAMSFFKPLASTAVSFFKVNNRTLIPNKCAKSRAAIKSVSVVLRPSDTLPAHQLLCQLSDEGFKPSMGEVPDPP